MLFVSFWECIDPSFHYHGSVKNGCILLDELLHCSWYLYTWDNLDLLVRCLEKVPNIFFQMVVGWWFTIVQPLKHHKKKQESKNSPLGILRIFETCSSFFVTLARWRIFFVHTREIQKHHLVKYKNPNHKKYIKLTFGMVAIFVFLPGVSANSCRPTFCFIPIFNRKYFNIFKPGPFSSQLC